MQRHSDLRSMTTALNKKKIISLISAHNSMFCQGVFASLQTLFIFVFLCQNGCYVCAYFVILYVFSAACVALLFPQLGVRVNCDNFQADRVLCLPLWFSSSSFSSLQCFLLFHTLHAHKFSARSFRAVSQDVRLS